MFLGPFNKKDINAGVEEWRSTPDAVLLDVRTKEEYWDKHIVGSKNISLDSLFDISSTVPDKSTRLYVHCLSGARSATAVSALKRMGYTNVQNIGGISSFKGETE